MKAFLMAAGYGTRLKPITDTIPKCLVPINDKPLLVYWDELFEKHGINEVLINVHYLADQVQSFLKDYPRFTCIHEKELLGSAGTLYENQNFITSDEPFFICYADNLTNTNLTDMLRFHIETQGLLTMKLFESSNPKACGIVTLDQKNKIIDFEEKPQNPKSNLANGGIYVTDKRIFNFISEQHKDLGKEILPNLPDSYGYCSNDYLIDIGTMENYLKAREDVKNGLFNSYY